MAESSPAGTKETTPPLRDCHAPSPSTAALPAPMALRVSGIVLLIATAVHTVVCYRTGAELDSVSGAWAALADDFYRGTFYRPLWGSLGWGGTRAFPLYFSLHALAMRCGMSLINAGYLVSGLSGLLAVFGAYVLLRRLAV